MKNFKAGNYVSQGTFKSFIPAEINRGWTLDDMEVIELLSQADRQLGRLDMYSEHTPNIDLFISMPTTDNQLKAGKSIAEIFLTDNQTKVRLGMDNWRQDFWEI